MTGRLAAISLEDTDNTLIYAMPDAKWGALTVSLLAREAAQKIRLAITSGGAPLAADWVEFDTQLAASDVLERTGVVVGPNQKIYARTDAAGVSVAVWGVIEGVV